MAKVGASNDNHKSSKGKGVMMNGTCEDDRKRKLALRVTAERGRRRKMSKLYADLHALLLPNLPTDQPKVAKATIVKAAMDSIQFLEQTLENLEKQKLERLQGHVFNDTANDVVPSENPIINNNDDDEPLLVNQQQQQRQQQVLLNSFETWSSPNVTISMCGTDAHISICSLKKPELFTTICFILNNHNHEIVSAQISSDDVKTMYMIHIRANVPAELVEGFPYEEMYKKAVTSIMDALAG